MTIRPYPTHYKCSQSKLTTKIAVAAGIFITKAINRTLAILLVAGQALVNINIKSTPREKFHKTMTPTPRAL